MLRVWTLYWRDQNLKYHRYHPLDPSPESKTYSITSMAEPIPFSGIATGYARPGDALTG
jgi:hypothetical protein